MAWFGFTVNHYHHIDKEVDKKLDSILSGITTLFERSMKMTAAMERLTREVSEMKTVSTSAILLLKKLAQMIRDGAEDPVAMNKLADDLDSQQGELGAAITENTPFEEEPSTE